MQSVASLFTTYLPYFILVLTLLVFVHEFGHYWVARRFGIHAEVFSIGFGPEIVGWTDRNGTRWKISAIPLGGYVKFLGDNDETSATPSDKPLSPADRRRAFFSQPLYARTAVVLGGPMANLLFAFVLLTGVFYCHGRAILASGRGGAAGRTGSPGRPAQRRRGRRPQWQARRSLRRYSGSADPLPRPADVDRIPARWPDSAWRDRPAVLRADPIATTIRCGMAISAWISSSGRSSGIYRQ